MLSGIIGTLPSPAKLALAAAQVKVTREELLQEIHDLDKDAFEAVASLEGFAEKISENSEDSLETKRKEILRSVEDYRARTHLALDKLESIISSFGTPQSEPLASLPVSQPRAEMENKFTPQSARLSLIHI